MKKFLLPIVCCSLLLSSTTSCGLAQWAVLSDPDASNQTKGAVVGAVSGAQAGSFIGSLFGRGYHHRRDNSLLGAAVGAVAGAALGAAIGSDKDKKAEQRAEEVYMSDEARPSGARVSRRGDNCIYYGQSKTKLDGGAKSALDRVAVKLLNDPTACAEIYGHTDNFGTYNERCRLSVERAQVVKAYLIKKGVPANQIFCKGCADQHPIGDNNTADGRAVNRRVEIIVTHNVDDEYSAPAARPAAPSTVRHSEEAPVQSAETETYGNSNIIE